MQALFNLVLGELIAKENLDNQEQCEKGLIYLGAAATLYTTNSEVLSVEEYSRVNLSLSTLYRYKGDHGQSKRHLELAKDKMTDKRDLLKFYQESASILTEEKKFHHALDSSKKALELAK